MEDKIGGIAEVAVAVYETGTVTELLEDWSVSEP
jgi:hypothetical protein